MKTILMFLLLTVACSASTDTIGTDEPAPDYSDWAAVHIRAQFPSETASFDCITVWVVQTAPGADACVVSSDGVTGSDCVSDADPLIMYRMPHPKGSCMIEMVSCDAVRCQ